MDSFPATDIFKALGDNHRLGAYLALRRRELCVCQLVELLQLAPSTVSKHLSLLKSVGLIDSRKNGRWVYYRAFEAIDTFDKQLDSLLAVVEKTDNGRTIARRLKDILKLDPEHLCQIQRG